MVSKKGVHHGDCTIDLLAALNKFVTLRDIRRQVGCDAIIKGGLSRRLCQLRCRLRSSSVLELTPHLAHIALKLTPTLPDRVHLSLNVYRLASNG